MKIIVSTSIAGLLRAVSLDEALETVARAGYTQVDFPLSVFSRPAGSPLKGEGWQGWTRELRRKLDALGLQVVQAHASWEQAIGEDLAFQEPFPVYERTIAACSILGCPNLVFHAPLYFFPMGDGAARRRVTDWNIRWFSRLVPHLEEAGVTAALENTFDYRRVQRPGAPPFTYTSAEDMLELVEGIGSQRVGICLDTGHANIAGQNPAGMIRAYGDRLKVLHLNDNFGLIGPVYEDLHLFPGHGNLNWGEIFRALRETGFTGSFNLEPVGALPGLSPAVRVLQLRSAREVVTRMAREAGY